MAGAADITGADAEKTRAGAGGEGDIGWVRSTEGIDLVRRGQDVIVIDLHSRLPAHQLAVPDHGELGRTVDVMTVDTGDYAVIGAIPVGIKPDTVHVQMIPMGIERHIAAIGGKVLIITEAGDHRVGRGQQVPVGIMAGETEGVVVWIQVVIRGVRDVHGLPAVDTLEPIAGLVVVTAGAIGSDVTVDMGDRVVVAIITLLAGPDRETATGRIGCRRIETMPGCVEAPAGAVSIGAVRVANNIRRSYGLDNRRIFIMTGGAPFLLTGLKGASSIDSIEPVNLGTDCGVINTVIGASGTVACITDIGL